MNNKKGFTLIELIVSFALITVVSLAFFKTILVLQEEQLKNISKNSYKAFTIVLNNSIQKDFLNDNIEKIISCGENCYDITYTKNGITRLSIDKENNTITYGNIKEKLPKDYKFINNIEFTSYINSYEGNDSYIALNINLKGTYEKNIQNIKYVYQYDSDNGIIELDIDGAEASDIIEYLLYSSPEENGLYEPLLPDGTSTGIRYYGENPNNYVYFNCEDKDTSNVSYGEDNYNYKNSCEVWRIIGVFDVDNGKGNIEKRVKLINTNSTFKASWDSSASSGGKVENSGWGINQWGESTYEDGSVYKGSDLMQLLNGYYIGKVGAECIYCNWSGQETCSNICTEETLKTSNMKVLTTTSKRMIEDVIWDTYGVYSVSGIIRIANIRDVYLQEKGISAQYTGKICTLDSLCNDKVERTTSWTGLVGLMSVSDITYANGWLYNSKNQQWTITSYATSGDASLIWSSHHHYSDSNAATGSAAASKLGVSPSLYLKSNIQIIDGNGTEANPYILNINNG